MITKLNVEVIERPFGVVLELTANGAQLQTAQLSSLGHSHLRARTDKHYIQSGASRPSRSECGSPRKNRLDDGGVAEGLVGTVVVLPTVPVQ